MTDKIRSRSKLSARRRPFLLRSVDTARVAASAFVEIFSRSQALSWPANH